VFAPTKSFDDESEVEEAKDEHIELLKPGEDSGEALEGTEEPLIGRQLSGISRLFKIFLKVPVPS
jgi:hypothetical protein